MKRLSALILSCVLIDTVQQERGETAPETERVQTEDGAVDFEVGADEEQFNMGFPQEIGRAHV